MPGIRDTLIGGSLLNKYDLLSSLPTSHNESRFLAVDNEHSLSLKHARFVEIKCRRLANTAEQRRRLEDTLDYDHHLKGHPFIRYIDKIAEDKKGFYIVLPTFSSGRLGLTLSELDFDPYDTKYVKSLISDLFSATNHCHSRGVFHRNINFDTVVSANKHLYLENFENATTKTLSRELVAFDRSFCPPESLTDVCRIIGYKSGASDSWAIGVLLFFLLTRRKPWEEATLDSGDYSLFRADKELFFKPYGFTDDTIAFFSEVFHYHEPLRPTLQQMYERVRKFDQFLVARPPVQVRRRFKPEPTPVPVPTPTPKVEPPKREVEEKPRMSRKIGRKVAKLVKKHGQYRRL